MGNSGLAAPARLGSLLDSKADSVLFSHPNLEPLTSRRTLYLSIAAVLAFTGIGYVGVSWINAGALSPGAQVAPASEWRTTPGTSSIDVAALREYSLLQESLGKADYDVEFQGQIRQRAINWVFRWKDDRNYYASKLLEREQGRASLVRWKVEDGVASPISVVPVRLNSNGIAAIRLEVKNASYTTFVNGRRVDHFRDSSFMTGGFGFSNDRQEIGTRGEVRFQTLDTRVAAAVPTAR
jgi:hypothetical protein